MGKKSHVATYSVLLEYLQHNGVDLSAAGTNDRGLSLHHALEFIDLLAANCVRPLGFEPWRRTDNAYNIHSAGVWDLEEVGPEWIDEAKRYLLVLDLKPLDVIAVQF